MKKLIGPLVVLGLIAAGVWYVVRPQPQTLGTPPAAEVAARPIGELTTDDVGQTVRIEGTIAKECPHTGCWAYVEDDSGQIRIDTNKGGFSLPLKREGSRIVVTGTLEVKDNGDLELSATSARL